MSHEMLAGKLPDTQHHPKFQGTVDLLESYTPQQRVEAFRANFEGDPVPLPAIALVPTLCQTYPAAFFNEIIEAHRRYKVFTVAVLSNYRTATDGFMVDARSVNCGRLRIDPPEQHLLRQFNTEHGQFNNVSIALYGLLETKWGVLCYLNLQVDRDGDAARLFANYHGISHDHRRFYEHLDDVCAGFRRYHAELSLQRQEGLTVEDLVYVARKLKKDLPAGFECVESQLGVTHAPWAFEL